METYFGKNHCVHGSVLFLSCLIIFYSSNRFPILWWYIIPYILGYNTSFVKIAWRKADFVVPIDSKGVETEGFEILHVLQFATDTFLHEWRDVH